MAVTVEKKLFEMLSNTEREPRVIIKGLLCHKVIINTENATTK